MGDNRIPDGGVKQATFDEQANAVLEQLGLSTGAEKSAPPDVKDAEKKDCHKEGFYQVCDFWDDDLSKYVERIDEGAHSGAPTSDCRSKLLNLKPISGFTANSYKDMYCVENLAANYGIDINFSAKTSITKKALVGQYCTDASDVDANRDILLDHWGEIESECLKDYPSEQKAEFKEFFELNTPYEEDSMVWKVIYGVIGLEGVWNVFIFPGPQIGRWLEKKFLKGKDDGDPPAPAGGGGNALQPAATPAPSASEPAQFSIPDDGGADFNPFPVYDPDYDFAPEADADYVPDYEPTPAYDFMPDLVGAQPAPNFAFDPLNASLPAPSPEAMRAVRNVTIGAAILAGLAKFAEFVVTVGRGVTAAMPVFILVDENGNPIGLPGPADSA